MDDPFRAPSLKPEDVDKVFARIKQERERAQMANEIAQIVIDEFKRTLPDAYPLLDLRYGIADRLLDAGYRKSQISGGVS